MLGGREGPTFDYTGPVARAGRVERGRVNVENIDRALDADRGTNGAQAQSKTWIVAETITDALMEVLRRDAKATKLGNINWMKIGKIERDLLTRFFHDFVVLPTERRLREVGKLDEELRRRYDRDKLTVASEVMSGLLGLGSNLPAFLGVREEPLVIGKIGEDLVSQSLVLADALMKGCQE